MKHTQRAPIVSVIMNSSQSTPNHTRVLLGREKLVGHQERLRGSWRSVLQLEGKEHSVVGSLSGFGR